MAKAKKEKKVADLNNSDTKELLISFIQSMQKVEKNIKTLSEEKSDIIKEMKDEGFNTKCINQVIRDIRKQLEATPSEESEKEMYFDLLADAGIVETIK